MNCLNFLNCLNCLNCVQSIQTNLALPVKSTELNKNQIGIVDVHQTNRLFRKLIDCVLCFNQDCLSCHVELSLSPYNCHGDPQPATPDTSIGAILIDFFLYVPAPTFSFIISSCASYTACMAKKTS